MTIFTKKYGFMTLGICTKGLYFYISPNDQKWTSTFYLGPDKEERVRAKIRKEVFGHNFDVRGWNKKYEAYNFDALVAINELVSLDFKHYIYYRKKLFEHFK